ncbi:hypothetical protein RND71_014439 [Anisodus tanguticus]|uniref:Uncharacterized protein n=1 Tax=Anisodus tanguticus TaxID=243964 RepID=A0AAE1SBL3_9SOLA|nr:hypothetical protein RND71_014439 [Anisodus tanguticus]
MAGRNSSRGAYGGRGGNAVPPPLEIENEGENVFADLLQEVEYASAIILQRAGANFKSHNSLYQLLKIEGYFRNSTDNDPHQHLRNISGVCQTHTQNVSSPDAFWLAEKVVELDPAELEEEAPLDVSSAIDENIINLTCNYYENHQCHTSTPNQSTPDPCRWFTGIL